MKYIQIHMPCGAIYKISETVIAQHHATGSAGDYGNDVSASLSQGTEPLFASDQGQIMAHAQGVMTWADISGSAEEVQAPPAKDMDKELRGSFWKLIEE